MVCCAAVNCSNRSEKGFRLFKFPTNPERRKRWIINCRRDGWKPKASSMLCHIHFEENQWELKRKDGWVKLKQNAIPTIFNVPNPPKLTMPSRKPVLNKPFDSDTSTYTQPEAMPQPPASPQPPSYSSSSSLSTISECLPHTLELKKENERLRAENELLKEELKQIQCQLKTFLNDDQIKSLGVQKMSEWSNETIIKGLKMRFNLGVSGYNYLHETNYPIPSYSTLNRHLQNYPMHMGIFDHLKEPLSHKVQCMDSKDRFCAMSVDEMSVSPTEEFDKNAHKYFGKVTLGNENHVGTHITVILIRGVFNNWKQVIACEVTGNSTGREAMKSLITKAISFVESCGLNIISLTSDMGSNNRGLWTDMGLYILPNGQRQNKYKYKEDGEICIVPDVCHLLKNLKSCVLGAGLKIPPCLQQHENLPTDFISGVYISYLWKKEVEEKKNYRFLYHLNEEDVEPNNFNKMNVGAAIRFFSDKTAAGLELAVELKILPPDALGTAWFIRLISQWFEIANSNTRKTSITKRNRNEKVSILHKVISVFQSVSIGNCSWKPLNYGMIMSTISIIDLTDLLLAQGYDFVLAHRFNQDALENIFGQVRRRGGATPTALTSLRALKIICISQFISDVKKSSYCNDSDEFLLDYYKSKRSNDTAAPQASIIISPNETSPLETFSSAGTLETVTTNKLSWQDNYIIFFICGSSLNALFKKRLCTECETFLKTDIMKESEYSKYVHALDKGGLKYPNKNVFSLFNNCEILYQKYLSYIMKNNCVSLIEKIVSDVAVPFPDCSYGCEIKKFLVNHYFTIRGYSVTNVFKAGKRKKTMYDTASTKKRKI